MATRSADRNRMRVDIPLLGPATVIERFVGPHGFALFICRTEAGATLGAHWLAWRAGPRLHGDIWILGAVSVPRLMALTTGRSGLRRALVGTPGRRLLRLRVAGRWADAAAELVPVAAVLEDLPPPDLRIDRAWMKGGHPWYTPRHHRRGEVEGTARPLPPARDAADAEAERKPAAPSRPGRSGGRMRVWLAGGGRGAG